MSTPTIYLASQSPRRQELLRQIGVAFELLLPDAHEDLHALEALELRHGRESPRRYVERVTRLKLDAAVERMRARGLAPRPVLAADTTVAFGNTIHGKPVDAVDAARMLRALSGTTHRVLTAVAVHDAGTVRSACSISRVAFAALSRREIDTYVATGEPFGKTGAYAIQGRAAAFATRIAGSYSGIVGLPLHETAALLGLVRPPY